MGAGNGELAGEKVQARGCRQRGAGKKEEAKKEKARECKQRGASKVVEGRVGKGNTS